MKKYIIILCHILILSSIISGFFNIHGEYLGEVQGPVTRQLMTVTSPYGQQSNYYAYKYRFKYKNRNGVLCDATRLHGGGYYIKANSRKLTWYEKKLKQGKVYDPDNISIWNYFRITISIFILIGYLVGILVNTAVCDDGECKGCVFKHVCIQSSRHSIKEGWEPIQKFFGYKSSNLTSTDLIDSE